MVNAIARIKVSPWHTAAQLLNSPPLFHLSLKTARTRTLTLPPPLQIQRQQPLQDLLITDIVRPAIGVQHGLIKLLVSQV